jgi:3-polyprenyl-4-hydroxybenzoate decarboxylase
MISVSNHEFVELRHQQPQCKTHFVFTDIDIADLDIPEISSAKYQMKNGNAIGAYKKDGSSSSIASGSGSNKGKKIVAIASVFLALVLLGAGENFH